MIAAGLSRLRVTGDPLEECLLAWLEAGAHDALPLGENRPRSVLGIPDYHAATDGNLKPTYMAEFARQRPARG